MSTARVPSSTYRLQLTPRFGFAAAADVVPYLSDLGVSHVYCSPIAEAVPGSSHGYDVTEPARLRAELGGPEGFAALVRACREHELGLVIDMVPNHVHVGAPEPANVAWWDVLARGQASPFAKWFDIDWDAPGLDGKILIPVLGDDADIDSVEGTQITVADGRVRYAEHQYPIAAGTAGLPLAELLTLQHYRLAPWREESRSLNYRRFFSVWTLAGVRVEDSDVFGATHRLIRALTGTGVVSGLRIDHPDGLADPAGYLDALAATTGGPWTVVEKILEADETLPADWACDGTTGYDALNQVTGVFMDPVAEPELTATYRDFTGESGDWGQVVRRAKRDVLDRALAPEVARLARAIAAELGEPLPVVAAALRETLVAMPVYRAYVRAGQSPPSLAVEVVTRATVEAAGALPDGGKVVDRIRALLLHGPSEIVTRFQQTTGPVMAKGVEDTAFYRYHRLTSLCEVGGDPRRFGRSPAQFHTFCKHIAHEHPATMTTLSTHDTKRSEDVRARLAVLTEVPREWHAAVQRWSAAGSRHWRPPGPDRAIEYLFWQTLVGAWPIDVDRLTAYVGKAAREAAVHTDWVDGDPTYDDALVAFVHGVLEEEDICADVAAFVARIEPAATANVLGQKLVQLTMPGVPDVYQGCEVVDRSLVDPDNRRPVDFRECRQLLRAGTDAKLHVVATALRARRDHTDCFAPGAAYEPLTAGGPAADHVVAFVRGGHIVTIATRLSERLAAAGGWRDTSLSLPVAGWTDLLTGQEYDGGRHEVRHLLEVSPVALLGRTPRTNS
jgi:(1->4)-alpha-D-glucan 1-alpha-D-glucosylmutase